MPPSAFNYDYTSLLGRRVTLLRGGESEGFDRYFPRKARVRRQLALDDWGSDWLVLDLEEPFDFETIRVEYCLVRARWYGNPIGSEPCAVFVLFDPKGVLDSKSQWSSADFYFVAWGMIQVDTLS